MRLRLKASYTVENSIIIPVFTIIIVLLVNFGVYMYDCLVINDANIRAQIHIEQENIKSSSVEYNEILQNMDEYIKSRTVVNYGSDKKYKKKLIDSNRPVDFIRFIMVSRG